MDDKTLERLRKTYPTGTRVRLVHMDAPYSVPIGMLGTVPQTEIDIYIDECNHFNLKPTTVLTKEEIEKAIQE
ncbi:DUF4314 domain-containing protein [Streptococcus agalactiae]|uniref:DUF4314 domain-containing protein n=1 Tax=Streptococcus agalactiae TaxID=1311 RepID=UPI002283FB44|nr:DUF4314 domain-containing protein [Streptococcus agalactiae]MCY7241086.1 DUF4314 domain-containing protein [Streptococcus agalactiae]HEO6823600.1 DUF4314 domain-containing protein [Streptococcus agalactiae]HEO8242353.1 DUF4314 domain-containing protein [Streptococcus agalactiae]HEO8273868.1 DUF4314 domain-containing protein [Streptococcus agalactiae]